MLGEGREEGSSWKKHSTETETKVGEIKFDRKQNKEDPWLNASPMVKGCYPFSVLH